jgi:threonine/homoserine/homoserine lactone efflux protein
MPTYARAMPDMATVLLFALASVALLVVPGPAVAFIVARSIQHGRSAGLVSVLGVHVGSVVHVAAAALGLSALLASSAVAFTAVKYLGAAYLLYLGIRQLLRHDEADKAPSPEPDSRWRLFRQGVIVNVLNPKTAIFFLAFLPQFVTPGRAPAWLQMTVLGLVFIVLGIVSDGAYALAAGVVGGRIRRSARVRRMMSRVTGGVYLVLGTLAAIAKNPALR